MLNFNIIFKTLSFLFVPTNINSPRKKEKGHGNTFIEAVNFLLEPGG